MELWIYMYYIEPHWAMYKSKLADCFVLFPKDIYIHIMMINSLWLNLRKFFVKWIYDFLGEKIDITEFSSKNHSHAHSSVEKREKISHQKIFRQINSFITNLVKPLFTRNFCQKCARENSIPVISSTLWRTHTK